LVHCFAGCDQAEVIAELDAMGLWPGSAVNYAPRSAPAVPSVRLVTDDDEANKRRAALRLWNEAEPIAGTLVEAYLWSRKLAPPTTADLRYHPGLRHPTGGTWPAMVALVTKGAEAKPVGIHRTFLARDGLSKAPVKPSKMMLGPCRGGAVRLGDATADVVMIGEGIETCIAGMMIFGHPAWAALSTSGMIGLDLPDAFTNVHLLADGDDAGKEAVVEFTHIWRRHDRRFRIAYPPWGKDFNDVLIARDLRNGGCA
jgi:hypothetical protein